MSECFGHGKKRALYVRITTKEKKRNFVRVGYYCPVCKHIDFDGV